MVCVQQTNVFLPPIYTDKHGFCICVHPFYLWLILFNPDTVVCVPTDH
jgi:hypothetical protein